ncbi:hypothetical protein SCZ71_12755 [Legionella pneumophila serogroup 1]|uniref:hypothetical protein n=1 Tax=Legionella pneumophila TaxID=446 RepID=UPI0001E3C75C|nr:hypothetical protein [Legionella pneumophila]HAT8862521.1 hypothetical protein [Legionella pneumophila subsp. pneumophila]MDI9825862.1 hypothetical protein [Legionella pneumophila]MDW8896990.1 hypothetical protein [Legionella pneumophila]TIE23409.1 hypothetical protein DIZ73_17965 [Legionella pneumophila]TIE29275.1 hypothetical protein DIZ48_03355 [Legionella pneumophila]
MLNKWFYKSIIGISKFILPVVLLLLLAPQLMRFSTEFSSMNDFFKTHQICFLLYHMLFYLALYWAWPKLITGMVNRRQHELDEAQIKLAVQARGYLLTALVFFELMVLWR